jgi:hypothetical protein
MGFKINSREQTGKHSTKLRSVFKEGCVRTNRQLVRIDEEVVRNA